jgi:putative membrane protein
MPSWRETRGAQPVICFTLLRSGQRRWGLSVKYSVSVLSVNRTPRPFCETSSTISATWRIVTSSSFPTLKASPEASEVRTFVIAAAASLIVVRSRFGILAVVGIVLTLSSGCGRDQPGDTIPGDTLAAVPPTPAEAQLTDGNIVALLSDAHQAEINLARAAGSRAASRDVREFAARMAREHGEMHREVQQLATRKNIVLQAPLGETRRHETVATRVDSVLRASGARFDTEYMSAQVASHRQTLEDLNLLGAAARDADLRVLIRRTIPRTQLHLDRAIDLGRELPR